MYKMVAGLLIGVLVGSIITYSLTPDAPVSPLPPVPQRNIQNIPEISVAEAEVQRQDRYASIETIEEILALPTDFAESEALYVIAGRANSDEVQDLIQQAARIGDRSDRRAALSILLMRFTELDPHSALAVARSPTLGYSAAYENTVWSTWGRLDLDGALNAAQEGSSAQKSTAAQALYASVRNLDVEKMQLIKSALGINPGRNERAQQIYALADDSPADAIRYIESHGSMAEQQEQMGWLAYYLNRAGRGAQANYAELIKSPANRRMFEQSMASYGMQSDPEAALEKFLAEPTNSQSQGQVYSALRTLAQQDPEKAFAYLERIPDASVRRNLGTVVVTALAASDPQRALAWARENEKLGDQSTLTSVIAQIAQQDPQLALAEAQSIGNKEVREQAVAMVLMVSAQFNPTEAAGMLALIGDSDIRRTVVSQLGRLWAQSDFEAAVDWVSSLSSDDQRLALQGMGQRLVSSDVDRAIALLDQFPTSGSRSLRLKIARNLAQERSIQAAQSFISQYKGTEEYSKLQVSVLTVAAQSDPDGAMQLAESVQDERHRDQLYASIVAQKAAQDPQLALQWMESISSSTYRQRAMSTIAKIWYSKNPDAANMWLHSLPLGTARDDAIVAMTSIQRKPRLESRQLINTIGDSTKRKQATLGLVRIIMRSDPVEAERLLMETELTDSERLQYLQLLERAQYNDNSHDY